MKNFSQQEPRRPERFQFWFRKGTELIKMNQSSKILPESRKAKTKIDLDIRHSINLDENFPL
jgi:hypothetical protein